MLKEKGVIVPTRDSWKENVASAQCPLKGVSVKAIQTSDAGETPNL